MRAYLIDPVARSVGARDFGGSLQDAYALLGAQPIDCVRLDEVGTVLVCDDEGLLREKQSFFSLMQPPPFAHLPALSVMGGRCLLLGTTLDGEWADCQLTEREAVRMARWLDPLAAAVILRLRGLL